MIPRDDAGASAKISVGGMSVDYSDIGYPLAVQLDDGRVFTAYYFLVDEGNNFGGPRFIAGTFFRVG